MAACKGMVKTLVKLLLFLPLALLVVCVNFQVDVSGLFQGDQFEREIAQKLLEGESISHFEKLDERQILRLYIQNMPQRYDTLVVGSSRGLQITKEIAGCDGLFYNAGMTGEDYADILCTISWLVRYDRLPEHMIMVLDPWILSANKDAKGKYSDQNTANEFLATVLGFDVAYTPNTTPFYTEALFSLDYFQGNIAYYFGDHSGEDRPSVVEGDVYDQATEIKMLDGTLLYTREFREQSQQAVDNDAAFRATMPFIMCDQYPVPDQTLTEQFTALVDFLQGQGVELTFVLTPFHPDYYQHVFTHMDTEGGVIYSEEFFRALAELKGIDFYGSYDPAKANCDNTDFYDGLHVRRESISKFFFGINSGLA
ncbi:MAG: hypothetical protein MSH10_03945 [Pygmaiobacter massiliensis]|nr:hypothetical protein [Pygmaiobacter massiliensis]